MSFTTHVLAAGVVVDRETVLEEGGAAAHHGADTADEIHVEVVLRSPAALAGADSAVLAFVELAHVVEVLFLGSELVEVFPFVVLDGGLDAVGPRSLILVFVECEWCAGELFSVETKWAFLRIVTALR